jgi:hypothetical protein
VDKAQPVGLERTMRSIGEAISAEPVKVSEVPLPQADQSTEIGAARMSSPSSGPK